MNSNFSAMTPINDIQPYFRKNNDGSLTFIGESLELHIPMSFKKHGALVVGDGKIISPGIMGMLIDDQYRCGLNILAQITIAPSDIGQTTIEGIDYLTLTLKAGDALMESTRVLQDQKIIYILWSEFITAGKKPWFFSQYSDLLRIFIHARELTGSGIGVSQSVFEGIIAQLARDKDDIRVKYRLTDMTKPMKFVALKSISQATENTSSKLIGNYFKDDGLTSALRYEVDQISPFENILRGIATTPSGEDHSEPIL